MGTDRPKSGKTDSEPTCKACATCDSSFPVDELVVWEHSPEKPLVCAECFMIMNGGMWAFF